jgi:hypothetical protein
MTRYCLITTYLDEKNTTLMMKLMVVIDGEKNLLLHFS